jgi:3-methyladenine DNA glycosylase/8-oxoguanine DNA glycosylase
MSGPSVSLGGMTLVTPARADAVCSTSYAPEHPVDLAATMSPHLRGSGDPTCRFTDAGIWRTMRTPEGPATLLLRERKSQIEAQAWGSGAEWAIAQVPSMLGAHDDWTDLDLSAHPGLTEVRRRTPGLRLTRLALVLEALVPAIFEQKVTTLEAHTSWYRLIRRYGEAAPGPAPERMMVSPAPETWRFIPSWEWHRAGVDPSRSRTVAAVATVAAGLERTSAVDSVLAGRRLQSVAGIGRWTAAETTQRSHGDPDAVSVGDFHLAAHVGLALTGEAVDDDGMLELLEPWRGHRQRVVRLILASGFRKPRHGPRATIRDYRGI